MEIITSNYQQFKQALDSEIQREAEGFVKIGYLLRVARDTDVLKGHYDNVNDFAKKEYGLDVSQVSRFISINERFSENGYSDKLEAHYEGFGVAKLSIMLQLPDNLNETLTPDFTKSEINTLREEVKEESKVSDIEVMMEPRAADEIDEAIKEMLRDPNLFDRCINLRKAGLPSDDYVKQLKEILAPSGVSIKSVRVSGVGRIMIQFDESDNVRFFKVRQNETETRDFSFVAVVVSETTEKTYLDLFGEKMPSQNATPAGETSAKPTVKDLSKIAPVQKKEPKKEPKVTPAPIPKVKPEEAEIMPPPEKPESSTAKKQSEIIREDIAERIERLYKDVDEIRKDYSTITLEQRVKVILNKVLMLQDVEREENQ
ncbi:MAG: hypothetical protein IIY22_03945 [Erysipelotrichaceae bacterium]|nr:hypothetical protein [Erysipelotrichaceae bacterium]